MSSGKRAKKFEDPLEPAVIYRIIVKQVLRDGGLKIKVWAVREIRNKWQGMY